MNFSDEVLMAYADGELDGKMRVEVENALATDPEIAQRVAAYKALRATLQGSYDKILDEPIPDRLVAAARGHAPSDKRGVGGNRHPDIRIVSDSRRPAANRASGREAAGKRGTEDRSGAGQRGGADIRNTTGGRGLGEERGTTGVRGTGEDRRITASPGAGEDRGATGGRGAGDETGITGGRAAGDETGITGGRAAGDETGITGVRGTVDERSITGVRGTVDERSITGDRKTGEDRNTTGGRWFGQERGTRGGRGVGEERGATDSQGFGKERGVTGGGGVEDRGMVGGRGTGGSHDFTKESDAADNRGARNHEHADHSIEGARSRRATDNVIPLRRRPPAQGSRPYWGALAASFIVGGLAWHFGTVLISPEPVNERNGQLLASGLLDKALSNQLVKDQDARSDIQIGISFRAKDGSYCRTFQLQRDNHLAGLACRHEGDWKLNVLAQSEAPQPGHPEFRPAGSSLPAAIAQAVDQAIDGEPLNADAEARARENQWQSR